MRGPSAKAAQNTAAAEQTMATLAPDTALKCESPVAIYKSRSAGPCSAVSPSTMPGIRPWLEGPTVSRTSARKFSATLAAQPSRPSGSAVTCTSVALALSFPTPALSDSPTLTLTVSSAPAAAGTGSGLKTGSWVGYPGTLSLSSQPPVLVCVGAVTRRPVTSVPRSKAAARAWRTAATNAAPEATAPQKSAWPH